MEATKWRSGPHQDRHGYPKQGSVGAKRLKVSTQGRQTPIGISWNCTDGIIVVSNYIYIYVYIDIMNINIYHHYYHYYCIIIYPHHQRAASIDLVSMILQSPQVDRQGLPSLPSNQASASASPRMAKRHSGPIGSVLWAETNQSEELSLWVGVGVFYSCSH